MTLSRRRLLESVAGAPLIQTPMIRKDWIVRNNSGLPLSVMLPGRQSVQVPPGGRHFFGWEAPDWKPQITLGGTHA